MARAHKTQNTNTMEDKELRAVIIYLPGGSVTDYPEFFNQMKETADDKTWWEETTKMEHASRIRFTYYPKNDKKMVYTDHSDYVSKRQKNEELPPVKVLYLIPKKFMLEEEDKKIRSAYSEFVMGMYRSTANNVNGVYRKHNLEFNLLGGPEIQYDIKEF